MLRVGEPSAPFGGAPRERPVKTSLGGWGLPGARPCSAEREAGYPGPGGRQREQQEEGGGSPKRMETKRQRDVPRNGSPVTRRGPWHQRPGIRWERKTGRGVWKPPPAALVGTERLPWEAAQDDGLGKAWVDPASAESLSTG